MSLERDPWSDERLAAAYRSRFGGARSGDLATRTVGAVRRTRRPLVSVAGLRAALVAGLVVAVAGSATALAPLLEDEPPHSASPSVPPSEPAASGEVFFPDEVIGLRVLSVSQALAIRDSGPDATEIAVRGFISPPPSIPVTCPPPARQPTPIELRCPEPLTAWLTETPERLFQQSETGVAASPPNGRALQYVRRVEVPWDSSGPEPRTEPVPVILVGHFSDFRSDQCPGEQRATCRLAFVVDARVWAAGFEAGREPVEALMGAQSPRLTPAEAASTATGRLGDPIAEPWIAVLNPSLLADVDPRATLRPEIAHGLVWVVRELVSAGGRPVARTMLVGDDSGLVFAVLEGGVTAIDTVERLPSMRLEIGRETEGPVMLEVYDSAGIVVDVRSADTLQVALGQVRRLAGADGHPTIEVAAVEGSPNDVWISWVGGRCDTRWSLAIVDDRPSINLAHRSVGECRLAVRVRRVVVTFAEPVDIQSVEVAQGTSGG